MFESGKIGHRFVAVPTPAPRTPICIARGNLADLQASIADLDEGEICYAFDEKATYVKHNNALERVGDSLPPAVDGQILQAEGGAWIGKNSVNGGNF